jgi:hypothetical protein
MVMDVRPLQLSKAPSPIDVTLFGIVTEVRPLQPQKAAFPMDVTLFGIVTEVRPLQRSKAASPIDFTGYPLIVVGITKDPVAHLFSPMVALLSLTV